MYIGSLISFDPHYLLLQTLEHAFLQLCETSDQIDSKRSSPQGGQLESFESGRDESRPILGVGPGAAEEVPKYSGAILKHAVHVLFQFIIFQNTNMTII